jgi:hypothetical protein
MSAHVAIAAVAALAAAAAAAGRKGSKSSSSCPKRFFSTENKLVGEVFYHGSEEVFSEFDAEKSWTSRGIFTSPDPDTALFYGGNLYKVHLFARNPVDLDDEPSLRRVAEEAVWSDNLTWRRREEDGSFSGSSDEEVARWAAEALDKAAAKPRVADALADWLRLNQSPPMAIDFDLDDRRDALEEVLSDEGFGAEHALFALLSSSDQKAFRDTFVKVNEDVESVVEDYGTDAFYLNHQEDILLAAEKLGYDAVIMSDPSSTGESISYVVFRGDQVCILDRSGRSRRR